MCWGVGLSGLKSGALEALKAIATLCLADNTHDRVKQFGILCVKSLGRVVVCSGLPLCPVVACTGLPTGSRACAAHGPCLEVLQSGTRHVANSSCFLEADIDAFKLQVRIAVARSGWIYTGLSADYLPELGSNSALSVQCCFAQVLPALVDPKGSSADAVNGSWLDALQNGT